ncbi:hypothetical protein EVAR_73814_1 [Eumeta japonica]|uniref:Uncharacterized protein n=1 Tax=Eumeta variegata TaxID=151549 RepID=A0A4C1SA19_EUMVA|nr:hypothetical protein EVAR_73814_1 [Eumeta japonica]
MIELYRCQLGCDIKTGWAGPTKYYTIIKYKSEVNASAIKFSLVGKSSVNSFPLHRIIYSFQEAGNTLVTPLEIGVSIGSGDHLVSSGSYTGLLEKYM